MQWFPVVLFVLLGLIFFDKALRRGARRTWAWGRMGEGAPLSRRSYAVWGITFLAVALTIARAPEPGRAAVFILGTCFIAVVASGFADTRSVRHFPVGKEESDTEP